ncbi:MAG: glutamate 5-kinase, partial [Erysipelotrichaceae bacterium]|nr:glutamate 5-kinase [Erysipelotrichaceae bacterium]
MRDLKHVKNIIIKIGSSSLCNEKGQIDSERFLGFIQQIAQLRKEGYQITLVSSGAIRAGMKVMSLSDKPQAIPENQALAAIGQATLMRMYDEMFSLFHIHCAQILLNQDDFDNRKRLVNLYNALQALFSYDVLPIVNENDTLAVEEIKVGDNDSIASLLVPTVNADLVLLVSDIDGLYDKNPNRYPDARLLSEVTQVTKEIEAMATDTDTTMGTGGMVTKLKAAKACNEYGCDLGIVNGN